MTGGVGSAYVQHRPRGRGVMFYTFSQNNSGGSFDRSDVLGDYVIVEAENARRANQRAEELGIYFNGVDSGSDCECCGDRWYEVSEYHGSASPEIYGEAPEKALGGLRQKVVIHFANGEQRTIKRVSPLAGPAPEEKSNG